MSATKSIQLGFFPGILMISKDKTRSSEEVIARIRETGAEPGTTEEIRVLRSKYPSLFGGIPLVALGSKDENGMVLSLSGEKEELFDYEKTVWDSSFGFLTVKRLN
jgi:hypothetical protein